MHISDTLSPILKNNFYKLSKSENTLLENYLLACLSHHLCDSQKDQYGSYLKLLRNQPHQENDMTEANFLRFLVNDILSTNEYTLDGIANTIRIPLDPILEIVSGINTNPSVTLASKLIKLHSSVRRDLYKKITEKY